MSNDPLLSEFEKSAYNFIEELKKVSIEVSILNKKEIRKVDIFKYGIKAIINSVKKDIEDVEKSFEDKS